MWIAGGWLLETSCTSGGRFVRQAGSSAGCGGQSAPVDGAILQWNTGFVPPNWNSVTYYSARPSPFIPVGWFIMDKIDSYARLAPNSSPAYWLETWVSPIGRPNPPTLPLVPRFRPLPPTPPDWEPDWPGDKPVVPPPPEKPDKPPEPLPPVLPPRRPPGPRTVERKGRARAAVARLAAAAFAVTEALDLLDALWKSLPKSLRDQARREAGKPLTPQEKIAFIYRNYQAIDLNKFVQNVVQNAIEDAIMGRIAGRHADILRNAGFSATGGPAWDQAFEGAGSLANTAIDGLFDWFI